MAQEIECPPDYQQLCDFVNKEQFTLVSSIENRIHNLQTKRSELLASLKTIQQENATLLNEIQTIKDNTRMEINELNKDLNEKEKTLEIQREAITKAQGLVFQLQKIKDEKDILIQFLDLLNRNTKELSEFAESKQQGSELEREF